MSTPLDGHPRVTLLSRWWHGVDGEASFVVRSIAGALSRSADVDVLVPGRAGDVHADGLFDVRAIGEGPSGAWPDPTNTSWPAGRAPVALVVEYGDTLAPRLAAHFATDVPILTITPSGGEPSVGTPSLNPTSLHLHVPVNALAAEHPHIGFGFTDYVLVLSGGQAKYSAGAPRTAATWLAARFPRLHVVVLEHSVASVWRWRSLRGEVHVGTRTDLQRLIAHARALIDLAPGPLIARECVESLRLGTPIIVPAGTVAASLAAHGGGLWFHGVPELLSCVAAFDDAPLRRELSHQGRSFAIRQYGDPKGYAERVRGALLAFT
jgi:hypothetical protein